MKDTAGDSLYKRPRRDGEADGGTDGRTDKQTTEGQERAGEPDRETLGQTECSVAPTSDLLKGSEVGAEAGHSLATAGNLEAVYTDEGRKEGREKRGKE